MSFLSKDSDHTESGRYDRQKTNIKCVVVGDAMVGKTSLARRLACLGYIPDYDPTTFDNYAVTTTVDGKSYVISIFDTAGQEEFGHLRTLSYVNCDVFLLCFSVAAPESFDNAQEKWISEIRKHSPNTPIILVGTQIDLRDDGVTSRIGPALLAPSKDSCLASKIRPAMYTSPKELDNMHSQFAKGPMAFVSTKEGLNTASHMDVDCYVECSSVTEAGIRKLTEEVVENGLRYFEDDDKSDCHCACVVM